MAETPARRSFGSRVRGALLGFAYRVQRKLPRSLAWRAKVVFFTLFAPVLKHTQEYREFQSVRRWRSRAHRPGAVTVARGVAGRADVLVFGVIDWSFRIQRPQHLARELARRGHRVFYVAPNCVPGRQPGHALLRLDAELPLFEVRLTTPTPVSIYAGTPPDDVRATMLDGLRTLLRDVAIAPTIALVDHPGWVAFAEALPRALVVYDCMDNHHGFATANAQLDADERRLLATADAVLVSSTHLEAALAGRHEHVRMVRNACDPAHFAGIAARPPRAVGARPVVGYFGAIAEWFDVALLRAVAAAMPDVDVLLVGADTVGVAERLRGLANVRCVGEVDYAALPAQLATMDVLFVPFVITPLTLATNPVKAYEALAAGLPVVATPMPELMQGELAAFVHIAADPASAVVALRAALATAHAPAARAARVAFAQRQTWSAHTDALLAAVAASRRPRLGVVVVTWNGVALSRRCVRSLLDDPDALDLDVVVVDNASSDATPAWLDELHAEPRVRVLRNAQNLGFAAACNQGLRALAERGAELLAILNNDVVVTPGWGRTFARHLRRDPRIGLIGPITNNIGNEARVPTAYADLEAMQGEQAQRTGGAAGRTFELPVLAFFCVVMPRAVHAEVGDLDVAYGTGYFEDDDYCQRVRRLGRTIVCAEDVFVHHELSASFDRLDPGERARLFERNRAHYESKWGPWQRHGYRGA